MQEFIFHLYLIQCSLIHRLNLSHFQHDVDLSINIILKILQKEASGLIWSHFKWLILDAAREEEALEPNFKSWNHNMWNLL